MFAALPSTAFPGKEPSDHGTFGLVASFPCATLIGVAAWATPPPMSTAAAHVLWTYEANKQTSWRFSVRSPTDSPDADGVQR
jgi:hypothetical protein